MPALRRLCNPRQPKAQQLRHELEDVLNFPRFTKPRIVPRTSSYNFMLTSYM